MKSLKILILLLVSSLLFQGCNKKAIKSLESEAMSLYEEGDKLKSIAIFKKLFHKYPKSKNHSKNFFNIAVTYQEIDSIKQAIYWYNKILKSEIKDNEKHYSFPHTHTNIKHNSCLRLGNIYFNQDSFKIAAKYYSLALEKYNYVSWSGTSLKKNNIKVRNWLADCFIKLNLNSDVIRILIPDSITQGPFMNNNSAKRLSDFIKKHYEPDQFLNQFIIALGNITESEKQYSINLMGMTIKIPKEGYEINEEIFLEYLSE